MFGTLGLIACGLSQNVLLVRVPKTASGTVVAVLKQWRQYGLCNISSLVTIHSPESRFTRPTTAQLNAADKVIVTSRDPLNRFVSAFNWRHPRNGKMTHNTALSQHGYQFENRLYACFQHVGELADALVRSRHDMLNHINVSMCARVAWEACSTEMGDDFSRGRDSMIHAGLSSYVNPAGPAAFLARPLRIILQEDMSASLDRLYRWLECDRLQERPAIPSVHTMYPGKNDTYLSPMGAQMLRFALGDDYAMHNSLLSPGSHA